MKMAEQRNGLLLLAWATCFLLACIFAGCAGDVPDGVVYTDLQKTVKKGDSATLKCEFRGEPIAVYWRKEIGKDQWTDLITWVEGKMLPGSCLADDSCDMNQDYSLIINNVQIADRGRYMCKISNYLGILIDNYTDVNTYAPPQEPYPFIKECPLAENQPSPQRCSIPTNNTFMNITCSAWNYFPDLNLFFLHGSVKISNTGSDERTNKDRTKNKSIWIKGSASEKPYVCVASDIPGSTDERTATVFVQTVSTASAPDRSSYPSQTTMASVGRTDEADGARPAKIVVPVIIIITLAGGAMLIVYCWLKHRRSVPASGYTEVGETHPMLQTIKVHVEGMVSYYELWSLAYNTPKEDMEKVCAALEKLGMEINIEQIRREKVYDALCRWKEQTKKNKQLEQAQIFRDALQSVDLERRWQQIYEERRQTTARISEVTLEQILLDLKEADTVNKVKEFISNLIPDAVMKVVSGAAEAKNEVVSHPESDLDNAEEKSEMILETKANAGGEDHEDEKSELVSKTKEKDEVSDGENNLFLEAMGSLREWNKGPFSENPFVLLSLALEKAGFTLQSRIFFDGTLSFFELRSLLYNMETPDMKILHHLIKELEVDDVRAGLGSHQIYDALCRWKETHNKGDQAKILRDALERADLAEAWLKIKETRQKTAKVSEDTLKHILLEIRDPIKIQQFMGKLVPGTVRHHNASDDKDVIQQAMETLKKWSKGPFDENPMILLSRALERSGCQPVDRTFFYGTISYFELWSLVRAYKDDKETLCHTFHALGIQDVKDTTTSGRFYLLLSEWKERHSACDQLLAMKVLLVQNELSTVFEDLEERRFRKDTKISDDTLEHILWHVEDPDKIKDFLFQLIHNPLEPGLDFSKPAIDIIRAILKELKQWKSGPFDENPIVQLSLALERTKCNPVDRTFFKVPIELQAPMHQAEEMFVRKLTSRHCKRLANGLPKIGDKRISEIPDENDDVLFGTKSMIRDWIAKVECSNYEKRRRLDDAVIKIGRHDMTDTFGTVAYRREIEEDFPQSHPRSEYFNHDTIFDDDLISLAKLMSCLDAGIMSTVCTSVGISDQVKEALKHSPVEEVLREWRNSNLTSKTPDGSLESVFSQITELMGDKTYVKYVTDGELAFIEEQLRAVDKKERLLSGLHIHRNKNGKWIMKLKGINQKQKISVTDHKEEEIGNGEVKVQNETGKEGSGAGKEAGGAGKEGGGAGKEGGGARKEGGGAGKEGGGAGKEGSGAGKEGGGVGKEGGGAGKEGGGAGKQGDGGGNEGDGAGNGGGAGKHGDGAGKDEVEGGKEEDTEEIYVSNVKDRGVESVFADLLKEWRNHYGEKSCRKKLRTVLKTMGMEECTVNKKPRKYMYKAELVQVAFNILMVDVLPLIQALGIDKKKAEKYRRQNPNPKKGSLSLLIQLCQGTKELEAYNRGEFLPILLEFGYVDAAKSLYLDYEMSLCELSSIVSRLDEAKFKSFITQLGFSSDELKECNGTEEEANRIEVVRIWKSKIRPVPYHYRMHIVAALQAIGCRDLAGEVLSGHHRVSAATDDVIRAICSRLDGEHIKRLCTILKLKPDEDQRTSTGMVVRWVNNWMDEYDPFPKVIKGKSFDKFLQRKHQNNELVKAGFYELAQEIMTLEFSRF